MLAERACETDSRGDKHAPGACWRGAKHNNCNNGEGSTDAPTSRHRTVGLTGQFRDPPAVPTGQEIQGFAQSPLPRPRTYEGWPHEGDVR